MVYAEAHETHFHIAKTMNFRLQVGVQSAAATRYTAAELQSLAGALRRVVVLERKVSRLEKVAEDSGAIESPEEEGVVEVGSPPAPVLWEEGQCVYVDMRASVVEKEVCRAAVAGVAVAGGAGEHLCEDCVLKETLTVQDGDQYGFDKIAGAPEYSTDDGGD